MSYLVYDPAVTAASLDISNNGHTITKVSGTADVKDISRSDFPCQNGYIYFEVMCIRTGGSVQTGFGICDSTYIVSSGDPTSNTRACATLPGFGSYTYYNSAAVISLAVGTEASGTRMDVIVRPSATPDIQYWVRGTSGLWNNTNTDFLLATPLVFSAITTRDVHFIGFCGRVGDSVTFYPQPATWLHVAPPETTALNTFCLRPVRTFVT